jgi:hypothetical protein
MRALKAGIGLLLLPFCAAVSRTLWQMLRDIAAAAEGSFPPAAWGFSIGFGLWIFLFFTLPRPMLTYVLAHELTHALWAFFLGARVGRIRVAAKGGQVALSKTNFLIALAPYFFPLYTALVLLLYGGLSIFFDLRVYTPFWMGCAGLAWAFHLTFTVNLLAGKHQQDIAEHGRLFSYSLIYFLNALFAAAGLALIAHPQPAHFAVSLCQETLYVWRWMFIMAGRCFGKA